MSVWGDHSFNDLALGRVDDILNSAPGGVENVRIIHGKSTGRLRRAIREYLDQQQLALTCEDDEGSGGE